MHVIVRRLKRTSFLILFYFVHLKVFGSKTFNTRLFLVECLHIFSQSQTLAQCEKKCFEKTNWKFVKFLRFLWNRLKVKKKLKTEPKTYSAHCTSSAESIREFKLKSYKYHKTTFLIIYN